jgi:hypothetical protein
MRQLVRICASMQSYLVGERGERRGGGPGRRMHAEAAASGSFAATALGGMAVVQHRMGDEAVP